MHLFRLFGKKKTEFDPQLIGKWCVQDSPEDVAAEDTVAEFSSDGALTYAICEGEKTSIMKLTYRIEDGFILSDQPSSPREERTAYRIEPDGSLILTFDGKRTRYIRSP